MERSTDDLTFDSLLSAYAWCTLRRYFRHFIDRDVGFLACVTLSDPRLSGYFEVAAHRLFGNRAPVGVRFLDEDSIVHHVRTTDKRLPTVFADLGYRRSMFLFSEDGEPPESLLATADICVTVGEPDTAAIRATLYRYRGVRIRDTDAEFLKGVSVLDTAIALRKGVHLERGFRVLRNAGAKVRMHASLATESLAGSNADLLLALHGYGDAVGWGLQLISDMDDYRSGKIGWNSVERGLLLYGAPGTGKTRFAETLAKASGLRLFGASYAEWQRKGHQGDMLRAMRKTFDDAAKDAPSLIVIHEIDNFVSRDIGSDDETYVRAVVNGLLECLDGIRGREGVVVVATSNRPKVIDPAILRSGRIDTHIHVPLPDGEARCAIIERYLGIALPAPSRPEVMRRTVGCSGADLEVRARRAHRLARTLGVPTAMEHLLGELPVLFVLPDHMLWCAAVHECGHVIVGLAAGANVEKASLDDSVQENATTHRSGAVEFGNPGPHRITRETLEVSLMVLLAGMAAERIVLGSHDTGSSSTPESDLVIATDLATRLQIVHGIGDSLISEMKESNVPLDQFRRTNPSIHCRVDAVLRSAMDRASEIIRRNQQALEALAKELLRTRTMSGIEIKDFLIRNSYVIADSGPTASLP